MSMRRCVTVPPVGGGCSALDLTVGAHTDGERAALVGLGDELIKRGPKWHAALGGVDGFDHQVIYSSLCAPLFDIAEPAIRSGAYRARNRAMATAELDAALDLGLRLVWIPARAPGSRAPGHPLHDPFWTRLAERRVPFVLHVGSGPLAIGDAWMDDGRHAAEQMIGAESSARRTSWPCTIPRSPLSRCCCAGAPVAGRVMGGTGIARVTQSNDPAFARRRPRAR